MPSFTIPTLLLRVLLAGCYLAKSTGPFNIHLAAVLLDELSLHGLSALHAFFRRPFDFKKEEPFLKFQRSVLPDSA